MYVGKLLCLINDLAVHHGGICLCAYDSQGVFLPDDCVAVLADLKAAHAARIACRGISGKKQESVRF